MPATRLCTATMRFAASETGWRRRSVRIGRSSNLPPAKDPFFEAGERLGARASQYAPPRLMVDLCAWTAFRTTTASRTFSCLYHLGLYIYRSDCGKVLVAVSSSAQHLERQFPFFPELKQQPRHAGCTLDPWLFLPRQTSNQPAQQQTDLYTNTTTFARSPCPLSFARSLVS
jgi:hypothetical protein